MRRWRSQWSATATRNVPAVDRVADRLERELAGVPAHSDCLVHGDFRFGNVMISSERPPRISALLDWELATTGHPLADLGFLGARMHAPAGVLADVFDPSAAAGMPTFDELTQHYHRRTGVPIDALPLFVALSAWRWAIIVAGVARRFEEGRMGEIADDVEWQHSRVGLLAGLAEEWLGA
jgi:aminoglycoside phosphotransferase (APT) family kinase protein